MVASALYCVAAALAHRAGFGVGRSNVGLVSSVLFLIPGFPLVTALLDQLQHETAAALSRLAHAMMFVLTAAVGLSVVIALVGFSIEPSPQHMFREAADDCRVGCCQFLRRLWTRDRLQRYVAECAVRRRDCSYRQRSSTCCCMTVVSHCRWRRF